MTELTQIAAEDEEIAKPRTLSLYDSDVRAVRRVQEHFQLDSLSQAMRRCIRLAIAQIDETEGAQAA